MAQQSFQSHHGMVDILPDESPKWHALEKIIRSKAALFHFEEIRTPILEPTGLIARGIGQLTDIVSKEMFAFQRGDDQYVLRPECTAPVARAYIEHSLEQRGAIQKLFYIGPMFRAERPQKGRQRQFHQFGVELIGTPAPQADAEVIAFLMSVVEEIGLKGVQLNINSVGDPESREAYKKALIDFFTPHKSKLSELSQERLQRNPMRILDSKELEDAPLIEQAPRIGAYLTETCAEHFRRVKSYLDALNIAYVENPLLVRGLDYYTQTAFELSSSSIGSQDALGGGGRYDLLIEELGGKHTPAVGMAAGMERILLACEAQDIELGEPVKPDVYFVTRGEKATEKAFTLAQSCRKEQLKANMDWGERSLKAQMKEANRQQVAFTAIIGENELEKGELTLRDMQAGTEVSVAFHAVADYIKKNGLNPQKRHEQKQ